MHSLPAKTISLQHQRHAWKAELADSLSSVTALLDELELGHLLDDCLQDSEFRLRVPRAYVAKMQKGNVDDPLLRQVLPWLREHEAGGALDPVGDIASLAAPGLLHKYHGRALIVATGACAIHCRYCFRRHYPYTDAGFHPSSWHASLDYLKDHNDIFEIILSGGDPLVLDDARLEQLCSDLESIAHIRWLRLHTRLPVVLPSRINDSLLEWMKHSRFRITMVIHANHANELGDAEARAIGRLKQAGITLLNQSVLLRGVNDSASELIELSHRLHDIGVMPYYLHLLDRVQGALHFEVDQRRAMEIMDSMRKQLPGFLLPRLVREESGENAKTAISGI